MADVLPVDASLEDIEVDPSLPFLDGYVQIALNNGAATYSPPNHLVFSTTANPHLFCRVMMKQPLVQPTQGSVLLLDSRSVHTKNQRSLLLPTI